MNIHICKSTYIYMYTALHIYAHKKSGANCANELMVLLPGPMPRTARSLLSRTVAALVHLLFAVCGKVRGPTVLRRAIFMLIPSFSAFWKNLFFLASRQTLTYATKS